MGAVFYTNSHKSGVTFGAEIAGEVGKHAMHKLMGVGQLFFGVVGWLSQF